jgi:hypothetical protein
MILISIRYSFVIARRNDEAIQILRKMDCFDMLAMTQMIILQIKL